jgi:type I restriction enzyme R subunit
MTEFKQIIGRGTRINEEYGKMYFTIMDFRNVTDLFADPAFDGPPIMVKEIDSEEELTDQDIHPEEEVIDPETGNPIDFGEEQPIEYDVQPRIIQGGPIVSEPSHKVYVAGVDVSVLNERVQHLDANGKIITERLRDYTKKSLLQEFRSLDDFLSRWNGAQKKKAIIDELESRGIIIENLESEVKKELDIFDLICHVAWDMPALTRRERAERVKKKNYFVKYGEKAREIIEALLEKYADEGIENIENLEVLRVEPFNKIGTPTEIVDVFGGRDQYLQVIEELEREIYAAV